MNIDKIMLESQKKDKEIQTLKAAETGYQKKIEIFEDKRSKVNNKK